MKAIVFIIFIGSFSLFIYMKFIINDDRNGNDLVKIENDPKELRKLRKETIQFKKEVNDVFHNNNNNNGENDGEI